MGFTTLPGLFPSVIPTPSPPCHWWQWALVAVDRDTVFWLFWPQSLENYILTLTHKNKSLITIVNLATHNIPEYFLFWDIFSGLFLCVCVSCWSWVTKLISQLSWLYSLCALELHSPPATSFLYFLPVAPFPLRQWSCTVASQTRWPWKPRIFPLWPSTKEVSCASFAQSKAAHTHTQNKATQYCFQFSCSVVSHSLQPHEPQHARPPWPSRTPRVHPNSSPLSRWCHSAISSSVVPFSSCPQSFPPSGVTSSHQVAKVLEFQLQHQSFQWTPRTALL